MLTMDIGQKDRQAILISYSIKKDICRIHEVVVVETQSSKKFEFGGVYPTHGG